MRAQRPSAFFQAAALACLLAVPGCESTIITSVQSREHPGALSPRRALRRELGELPPGFAIGRGKAGVDLGELARWAGDDPARLAVAAQAAALTTARTPAAARHRENLPLATAALAWRALSASGVPASRWQTTLATAKTVAIYNDALERFTGANGSGLARGFSMKEFATPLGPVEASTRFLARSPFGAGYFDTLIPADRVSVKGMGTRAVTPGLGVALVGVRNRTESREEEMIYQPGSRGVYAPFAAVAEFSPSPRPGRMRAQLDLIELERKHAIRVAGRRAPLAGDFTAPFALSFRGINDLMIGISGLLQADKREDDAGLYLTGPFDPHRIPVLMIHGLSSSPLVWRSIATRLMADPTIRENYQFWYLYYPTGLSIPESAAAIRQEVAEIRSRYDPRGQSRAARHIVLVGYSMGGVIAQLLATESGNRLWDTVARVPFSEAPLDADDRKTLREILFWKPVPGVNRVIFISTPHRGTRLADSTFAGLGTRLVRLPVDLVQFHGRVAAALEEFLQGDFDAMKVRTGIGSLSPSAPLYKALETAPFAPGAHIHSILGDRGRNDSPNSTDGIVSYASAHLDAAESEVIVPTGHDPLHHPDTLAELHRILIENLRR